MLQFTHYVGTSPGTTTFTESPGINGLGTCPPGYYGAAIMLPGAHAGAMQPQGGAQMPEVVNPYGTEAKLSGLGVSTIRWDLLIMGFGVAFAGLLGFAFYKSRKRRR